MKRSLHFIDIALKSPYVFEGKLRSHKKSAILEFVTQGANFSSECSIFPGLHLEDQALLEKQFQSLPDLSLPPQRFENLDEILSFLPTLEHIQPNLRFAYEALCFHFWLSHDVLPSEMKKIGLQNSLTCPVQTLITNPHDYDWQKFDKTIKTVKLKLGRKKKVEADIALYLKLHKNFPNTVWRIDANQAYGREDLRKWQEVAQNEIDYFENPCAHPEDWSQELSLPLALETGPSTHPEWWSANIPLKAIVHKPAVSEGFFQSLQRLQNSKTKIILSSTFEGTRGLRDLLLLKELSGSQETHGLGTWEQITSPEPSAKLRQTANDLCWARP